MTMFDSPLSKKVLEDKNCVECISRVLDEALPDIQESHHEYQMTNLTGKSAIFDLYLVDSQNNILDIEIQGYKSGAVPQRPRYHASLINANQTIKKGKWETLANVKIQRICITKNSEKE